MTCLRIRPDYLHQRVVNLYMQPLQQYKDYSVKQSQIQHFTTVKLQHNNIKLFHVNNEKYNGLVSKLIYKTNLINLKYKNSLISDWFNVIIFWYLLYHMRLKLIAYITIQNLKPNLTKGVLYWMYMCTETMHKADCLLTALFMLSDDGKVNCVATAILVFKWSWLSFK